jgi:hypothetical protein
LENLENSSTGGAHVSAAVSEPRRPDHVPGAQTAATMAASAHGSHRRAVTPTFYKDNFFCANRSAYQIIVLVKNFPKINLA